MAEHAAIYANPDDPFVIRVVLDEGEAAIYELDLRDDHGDDAGEIPGDWRLVAEIDGGAATGRGLRRARQGSGS
ncbi:hypothetical protein [Actinophytocola sediminis]